MEASNPEGQRYALTSPRRQLGPTDCYTLRKCLVAFATLLTRSRFSISRMGPTLLADVAMAAFIRSLTCGYDVLPTPARRDSPSPRMSAYGADTNLKQGVASGDPLYNSRYRLAIAVTLVMYSWAWGGWAKGNGCTTRKRGASPVLGLHL